jgi:hypothetical protein
MSLLLKMLFSSAMGLLLISMPLSASYSSDSQGKLYAVIFGILVNENNQVENIRVSKVIDPAMGNTDPVRIKPSKKFINSAKKFIKDKGYKPTMKDGKPIEYFSYFYYDPSQPERIDINPKKKY